MENLLGVIDEFNQVIKDEDWFIDMGLNNQVVAEVLTSPKIDGERVDLTYRFKAYELGKTMKYVLRIKLSEDIYLVLNGPENPLVIEGMDNLGDESIKTIIIKIVEFVKEVYLDEGNMVELINKNPKGLDNFSYDLIHLQEYMDRFYDELWNLLESYDIRENNHNLQVDLPYIMLVENVSQDSATIEIDDVDFSELNFSEREGFDFGDFDFDAFFDEDGGEEVSGDEDFDYEDFDLGNIDNYADKNYLEIEIPYNTRYKDAIDGWSCNTNIKSIKEDKPNFLERLWVLLDSKLKPYNQDISKIRPKLVLYEEKIAGEFMVSGAIYDEEKDIYKLNIKDDYISDDLLDGPKYYENMVRLNNEFHGELDKVVRGYYHSGFKSEASIAYNKSLIEDKWKDWLMQESKIRGLKILEG